MSSPMPPTNAPMPAPAPAEQPMGGAMITCPSCGAEMSLSAQPMEAQSTPQEEMGESPETQAMEENTGQEAPQGDEFDQMAAKHMNAGGPAKPNKSKAADLLRAYGK